MRAVEIACGEMPRETDLAPDEDGGYLGALQDAVGGSVEAYDAIFGGDVVVWCNENGIYGCPPNRAVYATKQMEEAGYLAQDDLGRTVREEELYSVLFGDLVATGFDWETGEERDLIDEEISTVMAYFSDVSGPESGVYEVLAAALSEEDVEANPPLADQASALTHDVTARDLRGSFQDRCKEVLDRVAVGTRYSALEPAVAASVPNWNTLWNPSLGIALTWEQGREDGRIVKSYYDMTANAVHLFDGDASDVYHSWSDKIFYADLQADSIWCLKPGQNPTGSLSELLRAPGWVECVTMSDGAERYLSSMPLEQATSWSKERELIAPRKDDPDLGQNLALAAKTFLSRNDVEGMGAKSALNAFIGYVSSDRCPPLAEQAAALGSEGADRPEGTLEWIGRDER